MLDRHHTKIGEGPEDSNPNWLIHVAFKISFYAKYEFMKYNKNLRCSCSLKAHLWRFFMKNVQVAAGGSGDVGDSHVDLCVCVLNRKLLEFCFKGLKSVEIDVITNMQVWKHHKRCVISVMETIHWILWIHVNLNTQLLTWSLCLMCPVTWL